MKKLILFAFLFHCFYTGSSQTDTIYTKKNTIIVCKITKKTSMNLFYSEKGVGKSIELKEVSSTSNIDHILSKDVPPPSKPVLDKNCNVDRKEDKKEGTTCKVAFANWARFTKLIKGTDTTYTADFWSEGLTENKYNHGVTFIFSDGTKHERPEVDINCKLGPDGYYDYICNFKLNKQDLEILSKKTIIRFKLYTAERAIGESQGKKVMESLVCLIKS